MARTDNTKTLWRVQVRVNRNFKWKNKGLYETREAARYEAAWLREYRSVGEYYELGYGFGNTRVVRHIRGEKK